MGPGGGPAGAGGPGRRARAGPGGPSGGGRAALGTGSAAAAAWCGREAPGVTTPPSTGHARIHRALPGPETAAVVSGPRRCAGPGGTGAAHALARLEDRVRWTR
ncbi:hypothetical protein C0Q95_04235 [Streptomyces albidoflavus]|nr:hypothetical protein C0Q95_04235 [Streptomyces albidoflavus]